MDTFYCREEELRKMNTRYKDGEFGSVHNKRGCQKKLLPLCYGFRKKIPWS
ncbi:MAG: hypothetical protein LUI13_11600 [Lachnospiraceae bacterium]|nr:hypothetical protein [Lachnospiraceae bacterium]